MKNSTFPSGLIPSSEVEWVDATIYTAGGSNTLLKYRVLKPDGGERFSAFSLQSRDFIDTPDDGFEQLKHYWRSYDNPGEVAEELFTRLRGEGFEEVSPQSLFIDSLKRYYAGYIPNAEGAPELSKAKVATPLHIASAIAFGDKSFVNPLSTGDFSEVNGINYSRLNISQYLGSLYLSPDFYSSGEEVIITPQNSGRVLFQGVSAEPRGNRLLVNYRKEEDARECGYLGVINLDTLTLYDFIKIPFRSEYYTSLAWLDDHTVFAGGIDKEDGYFYMWEIYDLDRKTPLRSGYLQGSDDTNILTLKGALLAEHLEAPQRLHPPEAPRKNDPVRISLLPDPENPAFAEIRDGKITVIIKNIGNAPIRLLDPMSTGEAEDGFSFIMERPTTHWQDIPQIENILNWGLSDYLNDDEESHYIELASQEEQRIELEFYHYFSPYEGEPLYLSLSYVNLSGSDCLKGIFTSDPMRFDFRDKGCRLTAGGGGPLTD